MCMTSIGGNIEENSFNCCCIECFFLYFGLYYIMEIEIHLWNYLFEFIVICAKEN